MTMTLFVYKDILVDFKYYALNFEIRLNSPCEPN
jgi:hypothetical protein